MDNLKRSAKLDSFTWTNITEIILIVSEAAVIKKDGEGVMALTLSLSHPYDIWYVYLTKLCVIHWIRLNVVFVT